VSWRGTSASRQRRRRTSRRALALLLAALLTGMGITLAFPAPKRRPREEVPVEPIHERMQALLHEGEFVKAVELTREQPPETGDTWRKEIRAAWVERTRKVLQQQGNLAAAGDLAQALLRVFPDEPTARTIAQQAEIGGHITARIAEHKYVEADQELERERTKLGNDLSERLREQLLQAWLRQAREEFEQAAYERVLRTTTPLRARGQPEACVLAGRSLEQLRKPNDALGAYADALESPGQATRSQLRVLLARLELELNPRWKTRLAFLFTNRADFLEKAVSYADRACHLAEEPPLVPALQVEALVLSARIRLLAVAENHVPPGKRPSYREEAQRRLKQARALAEQSTADGECALVWAEQIEPLLGALPDAEEKDRYRRTAITLLDQAGAKPSSPAVQRRIQALRGRLASGGR
jgi:hypothetical protein